MLKILQFLTEINFFQKDRLMDFDEYYDSIISNMSLENRIEYIESLIYRLNEDKESADSLKKVQLDKVIKCANKELKRLKKGL